MKKLFAFLLLISISILLFSCNKLEITTCNPIYAMDTVISFKFYNVNDYKTHYDKLVSIYRKYDSLCDDFNHHDGFNNVYDLNESRSIEASSELIEILTLANELKEKTNGYFNPLVGRLSKLWKEDITNYNEKKIDSLTIDSNLIESELEIINSSSIIIDGNKVSIIGKANIDLGAIAKGFATKKCVEYLMDNNIDGYLINAGESSVALGSKASKAFKVVLEAPYSSGSIKTLDLLNTSVASSSGKYQNALINNVRYHHIINPFTGYPSNIYDNVNVIINDSLLADCYSTALFSMDLNTAKKFIEENDIKAILYKDDKIIYEKI